MAKNMREYEVTIAVPRTHEWMDEVKVMKNLEAIVMGTGVEILDANLTEDEIEYDD